MPRGGRWIVRAVVLCLLTALSACHYARPEMDNPRLTKDQRDSLRYLHEYHYTYGTNLETLADTLCVAILPLKDKYDTLFRGDGVVVAEFAIHPADSLDSVWVKVAHSQDIQGWMRRCDLQRHFVPADSISQAIYIFSRTHAPAFVVILSVGVVACLLNLLRKRHLRLVFFHDIDSLYPLMLCLAVSCTATVYESIQLFVPDTWLHYYFNPTLSPFKVPFVLGLFLGGVWLSVVLSLAVVDDLFRRLPPLPALGYLLGLASCCVLCYFFFIWTTSVYVGYVFLAAFVGWFACRLYRSVRQPGYCCGRCGEPLRHKGVCPRCGALNR